MNRRVARFEIQFTANILQIPEKFFPKSKKASKNGFFEYLRTFPHASSGRSIGR
jgi:hypothetical protein